MAVKGISASILSLYLLIVLPLEMQGQAELLGKYTNYHYRSWGRYGSLEAATGDNGGYYYIFLRNNGNEPVSVTAVKFYQGNTEKQPDALMIWPKSMQPGGMLSVKAKGRNIPFRLNDAVRIEVALSNGQVLQQNFVNRMSKFRIANVIPAPDYGHLYLYFRNDDSIPRRMVHLFLNGREFDLAGPDMDMIIGGNPDVAPKQVGIIKYIPDAPMKQLTPVHIGITTSHLADTQTTAAAVRLVDPVWHIGTWDEGRTFDPDSIKARQRLRELFINGYRGTGNVAMMQQGYEEFFIAHHDQPFQHPFNGNYAIPFVSSNAGKPYIGIWSCADEPEGKEYSIADVVLRNEYYYQLDTLVPTMANLFSQKLYNQHSWYADIVGMDHYAAPTAPNVIDLTWIPVVGRIGELDEALEYSEYVKFNSEPRRNSAWVQFAPGGSWSQEPQDFTINIQFWMHIFAGAKNLEWYEAKGGHKFDWPLNWAEGRKAIRQLFSIRNMVMESEYANVVRSTTNQVLSRALIGPDQMIIGVINNTARFSWNGSFSPIRYNGTLSPVQYTVEFELPGWIAPNEIYRVGPMGEKLYDVTLVPLGGNTYRIQAPEPLNRQTHVFVIASGTDTVPSAAPIGLHTVNVIDSANYTLSWDVPFDNTGIAGYELYRNGELYAELNELALDIINDYLPCPEIKWEILAMDPSGNKSPKAQLLITQPVSVTPPAIAAISPDLTLPEGVATAYYLSTTGSYDRFTWQYDDGTGWKTLGPLTGFTGTDTDTLRILSTQLAYSGWKFRCIASTPCFGSDTSAVSALFINVSTGLYVNSITGISVYPNPANELLFIENKPGNKDMTISILDISGREVRPKQPLNENLNIIPLNGLAPGMYLLMVEHAGGMASIKLTKY